MIRKLENKDINIIMDIWLKSTIKAHNFIDENYWRKNYNNVKNIYIPISDTFVYEDNGRIKGFISIINNDFIGALFVDVNSQGMGIGSKLIDYAISIYGNLSLSVYKDNENAFAFYKNKNFKILSEEINKETKFLEYVMNH
ncbi:N-acetyltransferase [Paeniclostridium sp. NSJ-45]|uniref:N-acetyltransferase n=1 Tax=Paeniclostridium hominis TaxID=2764329 RepID=A0ABR7K1U6_9FIRM|nr:MULTISPECIES: N-acetyltransferase [Paeniclostridium]MBC6003067.1 N-acetyltransferase [Paeniclostridium hominis]